MQHTINRMIKLLNFLLVLFFLIGVYFMFFSNESGGVLISTGLDNLKYFTVLSNFLCGIVAIVNEFRYLARKSPVSVTWKLIAASEVGLTFFIVAFFLAPLYPDLNMYERGNLFFHLLCPVVAMLEMYLIGMTSEKIPLRTTMLAMIPTFLYASWYLANNLIHGIGEWPHTNDFYGFLNWGLPFGLVIFVVSVLLTWAIALMLRLPNALAKRKK